MGQIEGKPYPERWSEKERIPGFYKIQGGEELDEVVERAGKFLERIIKEHIGKTVLLVSHDLISQAKITYLLKKPWEHMRELERLKHTAITIFKIDNEKGHKLKLFNCDKHLKV